jgi:hypothetical protein
MIITQQNESMNSFFDGYVYPSTTLKKFVDQYDNDFQKKNENEIVDYKASSYWLQCDQHVKNIFLDII